MKQKPVIALASSIMTDIIGRAEDLQNWPGFDPKKRYREFPAGFQASFGGVGPNIAYSLALLGLKATLLGQAGADFSGPKSYQERLKGYKIDASRVRIHTHEPSSYVIITADKSGKQSFYPSYCRFDLDYCTIIRDINPDFLVISTDNGTAASMGYVEAARSDGIPYIFDPGQNTGHFSAPEMKAALSGARIVIVNNKEWEIIRDRTGLFAVDILRGGTEAIIVTSGAYGVRAMKLGWTTDVEALKPTEWGTVETTGAGDAFRAGLIYGLVKDWPLEKTLMFANTVAIFAVECAGAQNHCFTRPELKERYRKKYREELKL